MRNVPALPLLLAASLLVACDAAVPGRMDPPADRPTFIAAAGPYRSLYGAMSEPAEGFIVTGRYERPEAATTTIEGTISLVDPDGTVLTEHRFPVLDGDDYRWQSIMKARSGGTFAFGTYAVRLEIDGATFEEIVPVDESVLLDVPENVTYHLEGDSVRISWDPVAGAAWYQAETACGSSAYCDGLDTQGDYVFTEGTSVLMAPVGDFEYRSDRLYRLDVTAYTAHPHEFGETRAIGIGHASLAGVAIGEVVAPASSPPGSER